MPKKRKKLLGEMRLPLNSSKSKYVSIGLDPYDNFAPVIKFVKSVVDMGIAFTRESFENLSKVIPDIVKYANEDGAADISYLNGLSYISIWKRHL